MKRIGILLLLLALVPAAYAQSYSAQLSGAAVAPGPGDPDGSGFAVVSVSGTTLDYVVWAQGIAAPTAAGINLAAGTEAVPLNVNMLANGTTTISQQLANEIVANPSGYTVVIRNAEFPNGALAGRLSRGTGDGLRSAILPVVGKVKGAAGTNFVTDLSIVNNGSTSASVKLDFFAMSGTGQAAPTATATVDVAPGEQKVLVDVTGATLSTTGLGALKVTADQNVLVNGRVINDLRSEGKGTAGFAYEALESGAMSGTISFLGQDADFRTNIGYFNPSATPVTATFVARSTASGAVLGTNTVTIPGYSMLQQAAFGLISSVPEPQRGQSNFYVSWTANAPLFVYGSVNDNKTGDAVLNR